MKDADGGYALLDVLAALCLAGLGAAATITLTGAISAILRAGHVESEALGSTRYRCVRSVGAFHFDCSNSELRDAAITILDR